MCAVVLLSVRTLRLPSSLLSSSSAASDVYKGQPPQLLTEMAGFDGNTGVIVLAVTKLSVSARAGHMRVIRELHLREPPQDPRVLC